MGPGGPKGPISPGFPSVPLKHVASFPGKPLVPGKPKVNYFFYK